MRRWISWWTAVAVALVTIGAPAAVQAADAAAGSPTYTGTSDSGATWVAHVPAAWNGTLILYSHGYGSMTAQDAPDPATREALLAAGYAMVGSSYSGPSLWALAAAVDDQFDALRAIESIIGPARRAIAWGTSMGGLVSALAAQNPRGLIDGALTTCGIVGGGVNLLNYQLDGEYAVSHLLSEHPIKLVRFQNQAEADASVAALNKVTTDAQRTPRGRARIALAAALANVPTWFDPTTGAPGPHDYAAQEVQQQRTLVGPGWARYVGARPQLEIAAGGNASWTAGVDYTRLLAGSSHARQVRALYRAAGLDLRKDLARLTRHADIEADPKAVATLTRTSVPTGRLRVPALTIHTVHDQLVPVEHQNWYAERVARAGSGPLLRQAYVGTTGHCAFQRNETLAALHALEYRIETGRWSRVTPERLNAAATALRLPGVPAPRYVRFAAPRLVGATGEPGRGF
jgi:pimeloyl-ACP methyl ester carboxylesterase